MQNLALSTESADTVLFTEQQIRAWSPKRRDFMRMLGLGAGAITVGGLAACGGANASAASDAVRAQLLVDEAFWTSVQGRFTLNPNKLFMNIGTAGSMPRSVVERYNAENIVYAAESQNGYSNFATQRAAMAPGFGVGTDELVISGNTSDGMSKVIMGIPWQAGDVVITSNHEHPGGTVPLGIAVERYGIIVRQVRLPTGEGAALLNDGTTAQHDAALYRKLFRDEVLAARAAGQRVRAIMWSSPTFLTGIMLPIPEIMQVCKEFDLISICDGAHLPGMMAYDYAALGVDFMAGAAHKWQCAPGGTGILIVRNRARANAAATLPVIYPVLTSSASLVAGTFGMRPSRAGGTGTVPWTQRGDYDIASVMQSIGSMNVPAFNGVAQACADWDSIGRKRIETYVLGLSSYLKERIVEIWGQGALYSPREPSLLTALTSFNPFFGLDNSRDLIARSTATNATITASPSNALVARLGTQNIVVRNTSTPRISAAGTTQTVYPMRVSTHLWHDPNDIDRLIDAVRTAAIDIANAAT